MKKVGTDELLGTCLSLATALYGNQGDVSIGVQQDTETGFSAWVEVSKEQIAGDG